MNITMGHHSCCYILCSFYGQNEMQHGYLDERPNQLRTLTTAFGAFLQLLFVLEGIKPVASARVSDFRDVYCA